MAASGEHTETVTQNLRTINFADLSRQVSNMSGDERASFIKKLESAIQSWKNGNFMGMTDQ